MKLVISTLLGVCLFSAAHAAEVPNGAWSNGYVKIKEVVSYWSYTKFRIDDSTSCGESNEGWWPLPTTKGSDALDKALLYKKAMLLAAFTAGKSVKLRCEAGEITDLAILE